MKRKARTSLHHISSRILVVSLLLALLLSMIMLLAMCIGPAEQNFFRTIKGLILGTLENSDKLIIYSIRIPRILMAAITGAALSISGVVLQALLRNLLADPYVLGISGGAATGAIIAILAGAGSIPFGIPGIAFLGGICTICLVFGIAGKKNDVPPQNLLLAGVIVNAFFSAIIMFLLSISNNTELRNIMFWLMGDLGMAESHQIFIGLGSLLVGFVLMYTQARNLNLLVTGEETALQLGVNLNLTKILLLLTASLVTAVAVSLSGIIAFVGLMVPHIMRLLFGADHRLLLPSSLFGGAAFLIMADTASRVFLAPNELPVGVMTAFFGAPFFIYLLKKKELR